MPPMPAFWRRIPEWQRNLWLCTLASLIVTSGQTQVAPILPIYLHDLGVTDRAELSRWAGVIFGCNFITLAAFAPLWGLAGDKYGRKLMALRAPAWLAVCMTLTGFATSPHHLVVLRLLQGAMSGFQGAIYPLVLSLVPEKRSGWAMSILLTGQVSGNFLGPLLGGFFAQYWGARANFFIMAGFYCVALLLLLPVREHFVPPTRKHAMWREAADALNRPLVLLFLCTFVIQFALMSISPLITIHVRRLAPDTTHLPLLAGAVFAATGLASLLFASRAGRLLDAKGPARLLPLMLLCSALVCLPHAFARNAAELGLLRFAFGVATVGVIPAIGSLIRHHAPKEVLSRVFSLNYSHQALGVCIGSFGGGALAARFGVNGVFALDAVLLLINSLLVFALFPGARGQRGGQ